MLYDEENKVDEVVEQPIEEESKVIDLDLSKTEKRKIRINGDNNRILELNTSDLGIVSRLNQLYPKLNKLAEKYANAVTTEGKSDEEVVDEAADFIKNIDTDIRKIVDEIFDSNVSEVCAPDGSMLDPFFGLYRFEYIIEQLSNLYSENIEREIKAMNKRMQKHTAKYTKSRKK